MNARVLTQASLLVAVCLTGAVGCSRTFHRQAADSDAYCLIGPKSEVAGASLPTYRIEVDPRSRMFNPNNPDAEPMPPFRLTVVAP